MNKKIIITFVSVLVLVAAYWLVSPLFFDKKVDEKITDIGKMKNTPAQTEMSQQETEEAAVASLEEISSGSFVGLAGHNAQGTVRIIKSDGKYFVRFEDDFESTNGPDVRVYFGRDGSYASETELGEIKGNIGGQNYKVPASIAVSEYNEVWIWCKAFSVPFGKAELK